MKFAVRPLAALAGGSPVWISHPTPSINEWADLSQHLAAKCWGQTAWCDPNRWFPSVWISRPTPSINEWADLSQHLAAKCWGQTTGRRHDEGTSERKGQQQGRQTVGED